jgi:hypothetical protein
MLYENDILALVYFLKITIVHAIDMRNANYLLTLTMQ